MNQDLKRYTPSQELVDHVTHAEHFLYVKSISE